MSTQEFTPQASPTLPPVECAPWCEYGDGHPEALFLADQWCAGPAYDVVGGMGMWGELTPTSVRVYAYRGAGGGAPVIHVGEGDSAGVYVDATSARMLAAALVALADQIER